MAMRNRPHRRTFIAGLGALLALPGIASSVIAAIAVSFAQPEWPVGSEHDRDQGIATRKRLLDRLVTDHIPLIGFHLAWPGHGMVERSGTAYRFIPV